jgi:hypothetical protein
MKVFVRDELGIFFIHHLVFVIGYQMFIGYLVMELGMRIVSVFTVPSFLSKKKKVPELYAEVCRRLQVGRNLCFVEAIPEQREQRCCTR